jgi:tetratricopeptide (TPR) repeat protein
MLNNIRSKQVIIIVAMLVLVGFLFTREIKGLVKPKEETQEMPAAATNTAPQLDLLEVSTTAKNLISTASTKEISIIESDYQKASGAEKIKKATILAEKWNDLEHATPSAMYLEVIATSNPSSSTWLAAGDRYLKAFDNTPEDNEIRTTLLQKANVSFKNSLALDSTLIDAKTGLGVTIVNGAGAPMEGIAMLMEVVKKDPKNLKANMNLGLFAIKSGQFDKAIIRFNDIISNISATPEAYFYLATAYESLDKKNEAIDAYLNSKKLTANPSFIKFLDGKIAELKK